MSVCSGTTHEKALIAKSDTKHLLCLCEINIFTFCIVTEAQKKKKMLTRSLQPGSSLLDYYFWANRV